MTPNLSNMLQITHTYIGILDQINGINNKTKNIIIEVTKINFMLQKKFTTVEKKSRHQQLQIICCRLSPGYLCTLFIPKIYEIILLYNRRRF